MFKKFGVLVLVVLILLVIGGFVLPTEYAMARTIEIDAASPKVHALVGDLARWDDWTPWKDDDPTVDVTLGEKTSGVGAHQKWTSADGPGELTFTKSDPQSGIEYDMLFGGLGSKGAMTYKPAGGKTEVTWSMQGSMDIPVIGPYLAMMMDSMTGKYFESGLNKLKAKVEAAK